ncbi:MAG: hypothetical protein J5493_00380 [Lachnospiraceae bacterium]|nr:hypothetical protein [Lachnospiraceae bacterium]
MTIRFQKFLPANYVMLMRGGDVAKEGQGLAVWYNSRRTNILQLPATAYDEPFAFDDMITADFQSVFVQGQITYRIRDFRQAARMADFSWERKGPDNIPAAMELFGKRLSDIAKSILMKETARSTVRDILKNADTLAGTLFAAMKDSKETEDLGTEILSVSVLSVAARPETRKALEAAAREEILKEQDDAIYKRRNAAIEQERLIKENELNTEIRVIEKKKERTEKEQEIKRNLMRSELDMEKEKSARRLEIRAQEQEEHIRLEEKNRELVALETENENTRAMQRAEAVRAMIKAYENVNVALIEACALAQMDPGTLMAKAFMEMGENAGKIGTLNLSPELLEAIAKSGSRA